MSIYTDMTEMEKREEDWFINSCRANIWKGEGHYMPYGKSEDINKLKKKVQEKLPGVDVDNLSHNDMKDLLINEINKSNIDPEVKEKISKGDIDGLKEDLIKFLSRGKGGDSEKLVKMLKNNDMEGLKNQLMGMLLGGMDSQKKKR